MPDEDPYTCLTLRDRLQMLAFEAELARLPRSLISALWEAIDQMRPDSKTILDEGCTGK